MRGGGIALVPWLIVGAAVVATAQEAETPAADAGTAGGGGTAGLELHVEVTQRNLSWGRLPEVRARFENRGEGAVLILLPCDGSVETMRVPTYSWEVTLEDGSAAPQLPRLRCGNVNSLREEDFVRIEPGEHHDLSEDWLSAPGRLVSFVRPGRYTIRLRYAVDKAEGPYRDAIPLGITGDRTPIEALWNEVPETEVVSNEVTVRVRAPHGRAGERLRAFADVHDGLGMAEVRELLGEPDAVVPDDSPGVEHWVYWLKGGPPDGEQTVSSIYLAENHPRLVIRFDAGGRVLGAAALP